MRMPCSGRSLEKTRGELAQHGHFLPGPFNAPLALLRQGGVPDIVAVRLHPDPLLFPHPSSKV